MRAAAGVGGLEQLTQGEQRGGVGVGRPPAVVAAEVDQRSIRRGKRGSAGSAGERPGSPRPVCGSRWAEIKPFRVEAFFYGPP